MRQLLGEYDCKIDAKGRMRLPSALLNQFEEGQSQRFVINRGFENCLVLYPMDVWAEKSAEVDRLNDYVKKERAFKRYFYRGAQEVNVDSADRVLIKKALLEHASIDKEVILAAMNETVEIWSKQKYDEMIGDEPENFSDLAESVFGGDEN